MSKYGTLYDRDTAEAIRAATLNELVRSIKTGTDEHIFSEVEGDNSSRAVYIAGSSVEGLLEAEAQLAPRDDGTEIVYKVRGVDGYTQHSQDPSDATLLLACRDKTGMKVWIRLEGLGIGSLIAAILAAKQTGA